MQLQPVSAERAASTDTPPALHSSIIIHRNGLSYMYITCTRPLEAYDLAWVVQHCTAPHHFIATCWRSENNNHAINSIALLRTPGQIRSTAEGEGESERKS